MCAQRKDTQVCSFQRLGVQFSLILLYLFSNKCSLSSFCSMESTVILFPFFSLYYSLILFFLDCWAGLKKSWERWWNRRWALRTQGTRYWTQLSPNIFLHSLLSTLWVPGRWAGGSVIANVTDFCLGIVQCVFVHKPIWDPSSPLPKAGQDQEMLSCQLFQYCCRFQGKRAFLYICSFSGSNVLPVSCNTKAPEGSPCQSVLKPRCSKHLCLFFTEQW